jgi:phenylalanyl-tRNA synthetase beta chain
MLAGLKWLNQFLDPPTATADDAETALMGAGFPIESRETLPDSDVRLDVEVTSNRGDCLSQLGLAREIAAKTGRKLREPRFELPKSVAGPVEAAATLENQEPASCPMFTLRVLRNVKVGPSPAWLVQTLESVGQRSINNVVDVTNYITFELGHPCHVFDLDRLAGRKLIVRWARPDEPLKTLDGKLRKLASDELVVADAERAQSLAGVIGGGDSEVSSSTVNVALEMATWDPVTVRRAARRHQIRTDAGHRFERGVDARCLDWAARRAAALLAEVCGGQLCDGVLAAGAPFAPPTRIKLRPARCRRILGIEVATDELVRLLQAVSIGVEQSGRGGEELVCTAPDWRLDLKREIDLIEEVGRLKGLEAVPIRPRLEVAVRPPQERERAMRELAGTLTGLGFFETVTFSFVTPKQGDAFVTGSFTRVDIDDERRGGEPTLRPSILPSLLACRKVNQDGQVTLPSAASASGAIAPGVRLFETGAVYSQLRQGDKVSSLEERRLALLIDVPGAPDTQKRTLDDKRTGVRLLRGALETLVRALGGANASVELHRGTISLSVWDPSAHAHVCVRTGPEGLRQKIGELGLVSGAALSEYGLEIPVVAAELQLDPLLALFPARATVTTLPEFPSTDRDVSFIVPESVAWGDIASHLGAARVDKMERFDFVTAYRGKQIGEGKKSVTVRMRFRDAAKTLRREEVEPQVQGVIELMKSKVGAEVRVG